MLGLVWFPSSSPRWTSTARTRPRQRSLLKPRSWRSWTAACRQAGDAELTLPEVDGFYGELVAHPRVLKVVALSGGYPRDEANARLARQKGVIASFSRALTEGLTAQQSDAEFNAALDQAIEGIYQASKT